MMAPGPRPLPLRSLGRLWLALAALAAALLEPILVHATCGAAGACALPGWVLWLWGVVLGFSLLDTAVAFCRDHVAGGYGRDLQRWQAGLPPEKVVQRPARRRVERAAALRAKNASAQ